MDEEMLPKFDYYLDESDPDVVVLRRQDGTFVAAFSASGATGKASLKLPRRTMGDLWRLLQPGNRAREVPRDSGATGALNPGTHPIHPSAWKGNSANFVMTES